MGARCKVILMGILALMLHLLPLAGWAAACIWMLILLATRRRMGKSILVGCHQVRVRGRGRWMGVAVCRQWLLLRRRDRRAMRMLLGVRP
ncbi:hypothetical protein EMCG_00334 [[Emmonsia] crescens]|uniref:Uncharacterized protein n=1 Tax=[Emmonsia] crescens TaxID=73230 RepID=A0A0G2J8Q7_9EURO|nr:hypothetical protein EMCG_00334 [Emmonsia crescens UAMH 3008]